MARLQLSPPWDIYYQELNALFGQDKEIHVIFDEEEYEIKLHVDEIDKATALEELLLKEVVQYFNDNIGDINGNCSTLYEIIARDIFPNVNGIYFCTEATTFVCSNNTITISNQNHSF